jgi:hypothetical protein
MALQTKSIEARPERTVLLFGIERLLLGQAIALGEKWDDDERIGATTEEFVGTEGET